MRFLHKSTCTRPLVAVLPNDEIRAVFIAIANNIKRFQHSALQTDYTKFEPKARHVIVRKRTVSALAGVADCEVVSDGARAAIQAHAVRLAAEVSRALAPVARVAWKPHHGCFCLLLGEFIGV